MIKKSVFVLMPFSEDLSDVYEFLIKETFEQAGYEVRRADDIRSQNNILADIIEGITSSDLIVADLTDSNPNVYYELGVAHALNKNVVLLTQELEELPFDLRSYRVVTYKTHFSRMSQAKEELASIGRDAYKGDISFGNPVKDFSLTHPGTTVTVQESRSSNIAQNKDDDRGTLDYQIELDEDMSTLAIIIEEVCYKLTDELTPQISISTDILNSEHTAKEQRSSIRTLAKNMEDFALFIKPKNDIYRKLLLRMETCFENLLSNEIDFSDSESQDSLQLFINTIESLAEGARVGRKGFASLLDTQRELPRIEKTFNRSNKVMQEEVSKFIDNIDQTISTVSRAVNLGKMLISNDSK